MKPARQQRHILWTAASLLSFGLAGLAAWLGFQKADVWNDLGGKLAPDGHLEILTVIPDLLFRVLFFALAGLLLLIALGMLTLPDLVIRTVGSLWDSIKSLVVRFGLDAKGFFHQLKGWPHAESDRWLLLIFMAVSILLRAPLLDRPVFHDEAYTAVTWAPGPLRFILEDYHLPNNHIFHTLLVSLAHDLIGNQPWSLRLAAFTAGLLLIPAGYGLTRRWYGRSSALFGAFVIAVSPILTDYATNARGYSLFMLFSLLIFWLAARLVHHNNLFEWSLFVLFGALGFWTVPMMLYPFGAVCAWIGLSAFFDHRARQEYGSAWRLIKYLGFAGGFTILLTFLCYLPVLLHSGLDPLFNNPFIHPLSFREFWPTLFESRLPETFAEWSRGFGLAGAIFLVLGVLLSLIFHARLSRYPLHGLWAALLWLVPILLLRRPNAWARTWSFLYPLGYIWAVAGWNGLTASLKIPTRVFPHWPQVSRVLAGLILILGLLLSFNHSRQICPQIGCPPGNEEQAVMYLSTRLESSDLVLVESPNNAVIWYYFGQYGLSRDHFRKDLPFTAAYIILNSDEGQTVDQLISGFGFSEDWFDMTSLSLDFSQGNIQVVHLRADIERMKKEYGIE